jgi:hypothetical protein
MQGWSLFKLGRIEDALKPFFGVLDAKLGRLDTADRDQPDLAAVRALSRADRELVEDSFRVLSLSLASLQGAESIPTLIDSPLRESYQYRVYLQLADLYGKQERIKDAADTLAAFVRRQPLHAQAPCCRRGWWRSTPATASPRWPWKPRRTTCSATAPTANSAAPTPPAGRWRSPWCRRTWPNWHSTTTRWRRRAAPRPMWMRPSRGTANCWRQCRPGRPRRSSASCWPSCCSRTSATPTRPWNTKPWPTARPAPRVRPMPATAPCWPMPHWKRPPPTARRCSARPPRAPCVLPPPLATTRAPAPCWPTRRSSSTRWAMVRAP